MIEGERGCAGLGIPSPDAVQASNQERKGSELEIQAARRLGALAQLADTARCPTSL